MKINQIVNRVTVEARAAGVDQTTAAVQRLDNAVGGLTVANDRTTRSTLSVAPALERLRRSTDLNYRAAQQLATGQRILERSMQSGLITAVEQERMMARLQARYGSTAAGATRLAAANDNLSRTSSASVASATALTRGIGGIAAVASSAAMALAAYGFAVVALGTSAAQTGMQMQALGRSFAAGTGSAVQGARELEFVRAESQRLGLAFTETAKQYGQLVAASRDTPLQGQATRDIFIAVSQAMTALGKSADDTGGALNAIQQMMSKGKVQAEELRGQLGERLPGAFGLAAAAMGKTTAELNKMLDDGKVLATDLLPKLAIELNKVYGAASAASANDLGANINRLKNAWQEYQDAVANGGLNEALNNATKALTGFLSEGDGAAQGRRLGDAINWIVTALERVPRGAENFGILTQMAREALTAFGAWIDSFSALQGVAVDASSSVGDSFSAAVGYVQTAINGVIGVAVGGYQMVTAAWQGLPSVFAEIATNAGNALINGIAAAVNYVIGLLNGMISSINGIGAKLPDAIGFKPIEEIASVTFKNIENTAAGSASRIGASLSEIGKDAASKNYLGEFGKSVSDAVDGQIGRFRELRSAQDASNHLLREADKIAKNSKVADAYNNAAKAGKAAKEAAEGSGGAAKSAASSYDNLIQRTRDRIAELQLEAQYASKTATEVIKLKLAHDLERAAKKDGTEVTAAMRAEWDKLGGELAEATQNLERVRKAQNDLKKAQDAVAESFKSFVEELITGSDGIQGALKSLGKTTLSNSLDALISGKGPLAGLTGLAANDNNKQGGLLGALSGGNLKSFTDAITKGTAKGSAQGFETGFHRATSSNNSSGASLFGVDGTQLAGGLTAIAGLAGAYGIGASASSTGMGVLGGALSGAMAGAAVFGPIGALVGAIAGGGLGFLGGQSASKQRKEELKKQAEANYQEAKPQIASLGSQFRGEPQGTLAQRIAEAEAAQKKLGDVAYLSGRQEEQWKLFADFVTYRTRTLKEFGDAYGGMLDALNDGLGPDSPFGRTRDSVKALGDSLKVFIDDTKTVFGDGSAQVGQSRSASQAYALQVLDGAKTLSVVATRMEEIRGAGVGLQQVLADLGMSADAAADAIASGTTAALARLKASFETDLSRRTLDAQDKGYINEAADLIAELASLRTDAAALGTSQGLVTDYFKASAQAIVDGAQLTGDAFDDLIRRFPELNGNVRAFEEAIDAASRAAEIAARRLGYQDRLFAALNDTDTLTGQLAAYDRTAMREREEEIRLGGEAIADLEAAQLVERFNIIRDFNQAANDNYRQSLQQAQDYIARFARSIQEYLDGLRAGADSPLSPQARLAAAQSQYNAQLALAQGGNRDALDGITGYASDLLEAAKGFYASSSGFQAIFAQIESQLGALPSQISAEQFIVNAIEAGADQTTDAIAVMRTTLQAAVNSGSAQEIASALSTYFNRIDTNTDNTISFAEMQGALGGMASNQSLRDMFTRLDTDNSGSISRLEAIKAASQSTDNFNAQQRDILNNLASLSATSNSLTQTANALVDYNNIVSNSQLGILSAIQGLQGTSTAQLQLLNSQLTSQTQVTIAGQTVYGNLVDNMRKVVYNTALANQRFSVQGNSPAVNYTFAQGGLVEGPGTGTSDSISARLSNGEFVMRAAAVDRFGVGMLDQMNDNFAMPTMAVPVPVGAGGGDMRAIVAELKALRAELAAHKAATVKAAVAGAEHVREGVNEVAAGQRDTAREMRVKAA